MISTAGKQVCGPVIVRGKRLIDGASASPLNNGAVLIDGERVVAVGPVGEILSMPHRQVIDRGDETILPGLIDCHNHLSMDPSLPDYLHRLADPIAEQTLRAVALMKTDLESGVTTARCCGDKEFLDIYCRRAVASGMLPGPRLLVATRGIKATHGHGFVGYPFDGPEAIVGAVRENVRAGADLIKLFITGTLKGSGPITSYLSWDEIMSAVDEAHRAGLPITTHCIGGPGLDWALEAGMDVIEHAYHITDGQLDRLCASSARLVLTPSPILTSERVRNLPAAAVPGHLAERDEIFSRMSAVLRSGAPYGLGTDGMHGGLAREAAYLVDMGATPLQAVNAATLSGAAVCGLRDELGSLEPGKIADIICVDGNPAEDITALERITWIMKKGGIVKAVEWGIT
jgi:imidazolonepropionase-like amidohydrolase